MVMKLKLYMQSGVWEYWIVNLENKSILQYSFSAKRDIESFKILREKIIESSVFAELKIPLGDIVVEM